MKRVNYYLTEMQLKKLKEISDDTGLSVSEHIRRAIDFYMEAFDDKKKERKSRREVLE